MKREGLNRLRWRAAALPAAFLALSALCTSALAQAGSAGVPRSGCIPLAQANNTMTPPSLYGDVAQCVAKGDYDAAARLFALAGIYLHFDTARVSDRSASGVAGALPMLASNGATPEQKEKLVQGIDALRNDPARLKIVCSEVARIGRPGYYPQYMLASSMGAFVGEPKEGPLKPNFDAAGTWNKLQVTYLECPSTEGAAQQSPGFMTKIFGTHSAGAHMNDVAEKIAELHDPSSGFVNVNPAFSADGKLLAVVDADHKIHLWDWRNQRELRVLDTGNGGPEHVADTLQFSPDGRLLAAYVGTGENVPVRVWNTATWQVAKDITHEYARGRSAIRFSADSRMLLHLVGDVRDDADYLFAYSTDDWRLLWSLHDDRIPSDRYALAVSPTGHLAAIGGSHFVVPPDGDRTKGKFVPIVDVLDLQQRKIVRVISPLLNGAVPDSMSWSPDGTRLAVVGGGNDFEVYDVRTGDRVAQQGVESSHMTLRYSPNGKFLAISSLTARDTGFGVQIWDGQAATLLQEIHGDAAGIAFSRDSRLLAIAKNRHIDIWQFK